MGKADLFLGDCLEIMKTIDDNSIDMVLCDLPYGTTSCKWDVIIPFDELWAQYKRILKPNNVAVLFGVEPFSSHLRLSNLKQYKYDWVWDKVTARGHLVAKKKTITTNRIYQRFRWDKILSTNDKKARQ